MGDGAGDDFTTWYESEHTRLIASLVLVAGSVDAARDAADEAFARAYLHWGRVAHMANRRGWTYRVALNVLRRRARRSKLEAALLSRQPPPSDVPAPAGEAWDAVRRLPERQRTAVVLRFVADLTEEKVGVVMGVSRSTVSSSLADARRALVQLLADPGEPSMEVGCA